MPSVFDEEYRRDAREFTDALNVLTISKHTSKTDARRAYFKLARVHHPDKGGSTAMFQRVKKAYDHVTNDAIRQWAQRAFDYIERQAQREARQAQRVASLSELEAELNALRARNAERQAHRDERKRKRDEDTLSEVLARCMAEYEKLNAKRQKTTTSTPTRYRYADTSTSTPATRQPVLPTRQPKPIRKMSPTQRATKRARRIARAARRAARDARRATSYIRVQHRAQLRAT